MDKVISVIIPVYNVEKYLAKCLASIIFQTFKNLEIILVDDGSTDSSGRICDEYADKDNRIMVIHQENRGIGFVRNVGLEHSTGEYIVFIDSDDYIDKKMIEKLYNSIVEYNSDVAVCGINRVELSGDIRPWYDYNNKENVCGREVFSEYAKGTFGNTLWNKMFLRSLFTNIKFPEQSVAEDLEVLHKVFFLVNKISFVDERLYYYVKREDSLTASTKKIKDDKIKEYFNANKNIFIFIKEYRPDCLSYIVSDYIETLLGIYEGIVLKEGFSDFKNIVLEEIQNNSSVFNRNIMNLSKSKRIKLKAAMKSELLFLCIVIYEKYIGGFEKRIRKIFK